MEDVDVVPVAAACVSPAALSERMFVSLEEPDREKNRWGGKDIASLFREKVGPAG